MEIQLWREILNPYELAVREIMTKFNHLIKEHRDRGLYSPIEQVEGRVKTISSILEKCQKKKIDLEDIEERIYDLVSHGFIPIVAHVEQYPQIRKDFENLEVFRDIGAYLQVNAGSILGEEGFQIRRFCKKLMKNDMLDFVGSDCHRTNKRTPNLGPCVEYMEKKMGKAYTERIFIRNPQKITENIG